MARASGTWLLASLGLVALAGGCKDGDDETEIRCCMESICDTDFSPALQCLTGLIQESFIPPA